MFSLAYINDIKVNNNTEFDGISKTYLSFREVNTNEERKYFFEFSRVQNKNINNSARIKGFDISQSEA